MGKRLLYSLCTRRTLRTHDNIVANTFTYQEQLCGLENLRLWSDDEGDGSVLAMIQYSSNFKEGNFYFLSPSLLVLTKPHKRLPRLPPRRTLRHRPSQRRRREMGQDQRPQRQFRLRRGQKSVGATEEQRRRYHCYWCYDEG